MRGKIILEEHVYLPEEADVESNKFASSNAQDLGQVLLDLHHDRLAEMNANGVEFAIISQNTHGPQEITIPEEAARYAIRSNDYITNLVGQAPERFTAFAVVSVHTTGAAVAELKRAVENLGMVGVMVHDSQLYLDGEGQLSEYHYDDPRYDQLWATVEQLSVPVYLHPKSPLPGEVSRLYTARPWLLGPVYSYARDTSFHALAIITSGVFDRYTGVRLVLGHLGKTQNFDVDVFPANGAAGEMLLAHLGRIDHWLEKRNRGKDLPSQRTVREYLEANVYVTTAGHFSTQALVHAMIEIGVDRVLFSVDTPFENVTEGSTWIDRLPISYGDVTKIGRTNALGLFPRLTQRMKSEEVERLQQDRQRVLFTTNAGFR